MFCLEVRIDDGRAWVAGIENAIFTTAHLSSFVGGDAPAELRLAGMCDLEPDRPAHVYWVHELPLRLESRVSFRLVESDHPSPHAELKAVDSPEYEEEQRQYLEAEAVWMPPTIPAPRVWPDLRLDFSVNGCALVSAGYALSQDHFLCSVDWSQWRSDRLRIYARSFSGAFMRPDHHHTDWLRADLKLGDVATIEIAG